MDADRTPSAGTRPTTALFEVDRPSSRRAPIPTPGDIQCAYVIRGKGRCTMRASIPSSKPTFCQLCSKRACVMVQIARMIEEEAHDMKDD